MNRIVIGVFAVGLALCGLLEAQDRNDSKDREQELKVLGELFEKTPGATLNFRRHPASSLVSGSLQDEKGEEIRLKDRRKKDKAGEGATKKVPILRDLPLLGHFFGRNSPQLEPNQARTLPTLEDPPVSKGRRIEFFVSEMGPIAIDEVGHFDLPDRTFAQEWLCDRVAAIDGVGRIEVLDRVELGSVEGKEGASRAARGRRWMRVDVASDEIESQVSALVREWRHAPQTQLLFEIKVISADELNVDKAVQLTDTKSGQKLMGALMAKKGVEILTAPKILANSGQKTSISIVDQVSYIKDYDVQNVGDNWIADPIVDVISDGLAMNMAAFVDPLTSKIHTRMDYHQSWLARPIAEFETELSTPRGKLGKVTIQLPELTSRAWRSDEISVPREGGAMLIDPWKGRGSPDGKKILLYVTIKPLAATKVEAGPVGRVIGFNPRNKSVFLDVGESKAEIAEGGEVIFYRGSQLVGKGKVRQLVDELLIVDLTTGSVRVGDRARADL